MIILRAFSAADVVSAVVRREIDRVTPVRLRSVSATMVAALMLCLLQPAIA